MSILKHMFFGAVIASFLATSAQAQGNGLTVLPPASAVACLDTGGSSKPVYPELGLKSWAVVRVRLTFAGPATPPTVETTHSSGSDVVDRLVTSFVAGYRLPCMPTGSPPVKAVQEFQFSPGEGRKLIYNPARDELPPSATALVQCVTGMRVPDYPYSLGPQREGTVVVALKFVDAVSAPQASVLFDGGSDRLASAVLEAVAGYRMPCLEAGAKPLTARQSFSFVASETTAQYALKDLQLRQFVGFVDNLDQYRVRFDFTTMGCPFDVRLDLFRPHLANEVGEVERSDPNRREFIEWLRLVSLKLPRDARQQVIGQSMTISVPCAILDLT